MLKYGEILNITSGNSKTLIPRNLIINNSSVNENTTTTSSSNNITTSNFDSATITNLSISNLSLVPGILYTNIFINSPVAFSVVKNDYTNNNFTTYPIFFSRDIKISNNNLVIDSGCVTIKDNVIVLNNSGDTQSIEGSTTDLLISGFIFPISDQNISTGYYSGLLYLPNNQIDKISANSNLYKWTLNQFKYFNNLNKGFYKLKYLSSALNFKNYNNNLDDNYVNLINNNDDMTNLLLNSIALYDGEIVGLNNNININLSNGTNITKLLNINELGLNLLGNLPLSFSETFKIKDQNNNTYLSIGKLNELIVFYKNILLNNLEHTINFNSILNLISNGNTLIKMNGSSNLTEFSGNVNITNLSILNSFELNGAPIVFTNTLSINSNSLPFINLDLPTSTINLLQQTNVNYLNVNTLLKLYGQIQYNGQLNIQDINSTNVIILDTNNHINLLTQTSVADIVVSNSLTLNNDIPIQTINNFIVKNSVKELINFNDQYAEFETNINMNNNNIQYNPNQKLSLGDTNNVIKLSLNNNVLISGPNNGYTDISNIQVNSSLDITNTSTNILSTPFIPINKSYILSGVTGINKKLVFTCLNVISNNQIIGKIMGTSYTINANKVCPYQINIASYQGMNISYDTISPVSFINAGQLGDWQITNIYLANNNLNIECEGSALYQVVWGFKVDILQI